MANDKEVKKSTDEMAAFCKRKGFVFPNSEIYGSFAGFFDYGPLGVELKNNLKNHYWKRFIQDRDDVVGIDGSIISHPTVWKASGHADHFDDPMVDCMKCKARSRADHVISDATDLQTDGMSLDEVNETIKSEGINCPHCGGTFGPAQTFNLMFTTQVGPVSNKDSLAYLRPETAQLIFADYKQVVETSRVKLPFGIAQVGKAFRNEISPRNFLFRCREFEQSEIEFFIHPEKTNECPEYDNIKDMKIQIITAKNQDAGENHITTTFKQLVDDKIIKSTWHAYWLAEFYTWFLDLGVNKENLRLREHLTDELAHYAQACFDIEYKFPFGWQEIHGMADRSTYDLAQHQKFSKKSMEIHDEESGKKVLGHVIEPSQGIDRAFLTLMFDAFTEDKERENIVLKLHPKLAPIKVAVLPLVKKDGLAELAKEVECDLKEDFATFYDKSGSVGRRYARQDEIGTPYCVTIDYESKDDKAVTIRDRDSTEQKRVRIEDLNDIIGKLIKRKIEFSNI
ncbi:glycine--tRNA ligase [Candidatus Woesearchaeota archaeon]|nr:MAG: glycine--tRNA ligase [Candidatus Woesearchaeota archaeon]